MKIFHTYPVSSTPPKIKYSRKREGVIVIFQLILIVNSYFKTLIRILYIQKKRKSQESLFYKEFLLICEEKYGSLLQGL